MATRSSSLPWSSDDGPGVRLSRTQFAYFIAFYLLFSFHPLPNLEERLNRSRFSMWTYKYFSYRWMWVDDACEHVGVRGGTSGQRLSELLSDVIL